MRARPATSRIWRRCHELPPAEIGSRPDPARYEERPLMLNTPVALSVFNRPETTESVFRAIPKPKPNQLFVSPDGPGRAAKAAFGKRPAAWPNRWIGIAKRNMTTRP